MQNKTYIELIFVWADIENIEAGGMEKLFSYVFDKIHLFICIMQVSKWRYFRLFLYKFAVN